MLEEMNWEECPMRLMEELANVYHEHIRVITDVDNRICVWITRIDKLKSRKYLSNLEGRGDTYREACIQYIYNLMNSKYQIRYKHKLYATTPLRNVVRKNNIFMTHYKDHLEVK